MDKPKDPDSPERPGDEKDTPYVSHRLRSKLTAEDLDLEEAEKSNKSQNIMALGMLAVLVVVAGFLAYSILGNKSAAEKPEAPKPAAAAPADTASADTLAHADTTATPRPAPKPKTPPAQTAKAPEPETPPTPFGIAVGSYIDQARANEELTRLQTSTGLTGRIQPFDDGGITSYRVVLGSFNSRGSADSKANDLIGQDMVYEARVVPLK